MFMTARSSSAGWVCLHDELYAKIYIRNAYSAFIRNAYCAPQIFKTVASMYISAAGNQVSGKSAGQNENCMCICDKLYCGHALRVQAPKMVSGAYRHSSNLE